MHTELIKECVNGVLADRLFFHLRALQQRRITFQNIFFDNDILETVDPPDADHRENSLFQIIDRLDHLVDALTADILEITGFQNGDRLVADFPQHFLGPNVAYPLTQLVDQLIDFFGRVQDVMGRLFGGIDDGTKFHGGTGQAVIIIAGLTDRGDFPLGILNMVMQVLKVVALEAAALAVVE